MLMGKQVIFIIISFFISTAYAEIGEQPLPAEQAFILSAGIDQHHNIILQWKLPPGYYLYRDKLNVIPTKDSLHKIEKISFPQGEDRKDVLHGFYQAYINKLVISVPLKSPLKGKLGLAIHYQGCSTGGFCYAPINKYLEINLSQIKPPQDVTEHLITIDMKHHALSEQDYATQLLAGKHYFFIMLGFVVFGLLLAFTPCVLPMIPILSSIIVGYGRNISTKKAFSLSLSYVLGMALAYALAGILVALAGSRIQVALQMPWVIALFSSLFILLALSLFDWYDVKLPNRIHQRIVSWTHRHQGGTYISVFIMGVLSTLIVSPCVSAPLVGVLAYIGNSGDVVLGGLALMALGLGMGIPLLLIGTSAGKFLPKAGPWMTKVKQFFGLLILAVAIGMLSRILPGSVVLFLWSLLALLAGYFIWQIKHSKKLWHKVHQSLGLVVLSYAFIMMGGAFLGQSDPFYIASHSVFHLANEEKTPFVIVNSLTQLDQQLALAKQNKKLVLLDFYADWCVSCVVMDKHVFSQHDVKRALGDFILLRADVTHDNDFDQALLKRYDVVAPPTIIFFNSQGEEVHQQRIVGEATMKEFLADMNQLSDDRKI